MFPLRSIRPPATARNLLRWLAALLLATGCAVSLRAVAADPEPPAAEKGVGSMKAFQGLGFSVAPRGGGKAKTSLFGVVGEGYKFVYVFDRSGSMGGSGRNSLRAVKAELLESLKNLDTVHQFQIVFYNEQPKVFNPTGTPGRLAFATDDNRQRVLRFLDTIEADGGTDHEAALRVACGLQPDVIFFLTDGDDPKLTAEQLARIERWSAGITINTIEFGPGPKPAEESFLVRLARQSGGQYAYVDTSRLRK